MVFRNDGILTVWGSNNAGQIGDSTQTPAMTPKAVVSCLVPHVPPPAPGNITGPIDVCEGSSYTFSIAPVIYANTYEWSLPTGWTGMSETNSITVTTFGNSGEITVIALNQYGESPTTSSYITVHTLPEAPSIVQNGYTIECSTIAQSYRWFRNNNLISGATGQSFVASETGYYQVEIVDIYGCSAISESIYILLPPAQPGQIYGNTNVCTGTSNEYYINAVYGASSYTWTLPQDWTGSSTDTSITVTASATSGNIAVVANNDIGSSPARTLAVTGHNFPAKPGITVIGDWLTCAVTALGYQWYKNNIIIANATNINYLVTQTGYYQVEITTLPGCIAKSDSTFIKPSDIESVDANAGIRIYPNPVREELIIEFNDCHDAYYEIIGITGQQVLSNTIIASRVIIDTRKFNSGMYILKIIYDNGVYVKNFVKT
jgi:hypothetical protein